MWTALLFINGARATLTSGELELFFKGFEFFGFWMIVLVPNWLLENWMIAKLGFVFLLIIYHLKTHFILKELNSGIIKYSSDFMRIWNEVTSVILVSVVFLVVLKNNVNWLKLTVGLIIFIGSLLVLIKLYKRFRN